MRRHDFITVIAGAVAAWQLAAAIGFDGAARAASAVTASRAVMVYDSVSACNGVVLAQDLVLTAAHCIVGKVNLRIVGSVDDRLYALADVAAAEPHPRYAAEAASVDAAKVPLTVPDIALLKLSKPLRMAFGPALLATRRVAAGDRMEVVGRLVSRSGRETSTESAGMAVFAVTRVEDHMFVLADRPSYGEASRLGGCYGFSGAPVFAVRAGVPQLAGIMLGGDCGRVLVVTPIAPFRDWIAETAKRLGSSYAP